MTKRINSIDALRIIAAFFIICIHTNYFGKDVISTIAKFAVPVFFMISGYFFIGSKKESQLRSIKKIFILVVLSNLLFLFVQVAISVLQHNISGFLDCFSLNSILKFFILNESPFGVHLWFLSALLYCMIIAYFLSKIKINKRIIFFGALLLLAGDLVFGKYSLVVFGCSFSPLLARNFLFLGLPNFYIGSLFKTIPKEKFKISNSVLVVLTVLFCATTLAEKYLLDNLNIAGNREHYISTTLLAVAVFALAVKNPAYDNKRIIAFLADLGRKYSLFIYIFHILVCYVLKMLRSHIALIDTIGNYTEPFVVFAISLLIAIFYYKVKDLIAKKTRKQ